MVANKNYAKTALSFCLVTTGGWLVLVPYMLPKNNFFGALSTSLDMLLLPLMCPTYYNFALSYTKLFDIFYGSNRVKI
jgi:hypothetical protein